ncbi:MAG TPA: NADH:flavin oxidoreductase/NADH oxidase [Terriglobales bacterium]|nr:NADH:flavin oxidoreductase/NADH oxidase [Terriglobales bacterium]
MKSAGSTEDAGAGPMLFEPLSLRSVTLKNRIVVSPMSMYSAVEGVADDLHLVQLGRFAMGGAGLALMEAAAVSRDGRITHGCLGLWLDTHVRPLRRVVDFLHRFGCAAGIQIGHSGPKGSAQRPWHGGAPLGTDDATSRGEEGWPVVSSFPVPFDDGWPTPVPLAETGMDSLVLDYRNAARRAREAGFDTVELHCAHGYLLHAFLSPLVNRREDRYGGSLENRMRLPLRVAEAIRAEWPDSKPVLVRISAVDGVDIGWSIEDSVAFAKELADRGIDAIDCSSGGVKLHRGNVLSSRIPGFQVPFSARIRREAKIPTIAVGLIREPRQAEDVLRSGGADLVALGRELLVNPNWSAQAALSLRGGDGWREWPELFRWWLERRDRQLAPKVVS